MTGPLPHFPVTEQGLRELEIWLGRKGFQIAWGKWIYVGTYPTDDDTSPYSPPFQNSWENVTGGTQRMRFRRTVPNDYHVNAVQVEGEVGGGADGSVVFTLPEKYRPLESSHALGVNDSGVVVYWLIEPSGDVTFVGETNAGPGGVTYGTPAIVLGTAAAAGSTDEAIRRDSTIIAFDATVPTTQAFGDSAATGSAVVAARRDHKHAMPANPSDASITVTDVATNNASTSAHGFLKKLDNSAVHFMDGQGNWSTPAGTSPGVATDPIWDAAGDLVQGTGADAAARLAIGSEGRGLTSTGSAAAWMLGTSILLYDYTVAGSDKASIDTGVDTPDAGIAGTSAFSGAYRVLEMWLYCRTDEAVAASPVGFTLNNDATSIYDNQRLSGANTTASAAGSTAGAGWITNVAGASAAASVFGLIKIEFPNYAGTAGYKTGVMFGGEADTAAANQSLSLRILSYRSTSAVTRIAVAPTTAAKKHKVGTRLVIYAR